MNTTIGGYKPTIWLKKWAPGIIGLALFALGLFALQKLLAGVHLSDITAQLRKMPLHTLAYAFLFTVAGYASLIGYDWLALRYIRKKLPFSIVAFTSITAFGLSNTVGVAALSGGAVRYRIYSRLGLNAIEIASISLYCALFFGLTVTIIGASALVYQPSALEAIFSYSQNTVRIIAAAYLVIALLFFVFMHGRVVKLPFLEHTFEFPGPANYLMQVIVSLLDMGFAAATLYVLLPAIDVSFPVFLVIFASALVAGILSHVPGGAGVFESVIILGLGGSSTLSGLAAALLTYRAIYYLFPFIVSIMLVTANELFLAGGSFGRKTTLESNKLKPAIEALRGIAPIAMASLIFFTGIMMVVLGLLPIPVATLKSVEDVFPLAFIESSHLLGSMVGVFLIIVSQALANRVRAAYVLTQGVLAIGVLLSLLQSFDADRALILIFAMCVLWITRREFFRMSRLTAGLGSHRWNVLTIGVFIGLLLVILFSYKHVPYQHELWWQFSFEDQASRAMRALLVGSVTGIFGLLYFSLRPAFQIAKEMTNVSVEALECVVNSQDNPDANFVFTGDKQLLISDDLRAFIMYGVHKRSWIALGDPIGPADALESLVWEFVELADHHKGRVAFYQVSKANLPIYIDAGFVINKLGEEARVFLPTFSLEGHSRKSQRQSHSRARRDGLALRIVYPPHNEGLINTLSEISNVWLEKKHGVEKGFSVGWFDAGYLQHFPLALVEEAGEISAFANIMTTGTNCEATIDLMRHLPAASPNTMEFLLTELMLQLKAKDYKWFSLGMAPLSGLEVGSKKHFWNRLGLLVYRHGGHFYNFMGLRKFKDKFDPVWEPKYLVSSGGLNPYILSADITALVNQKRKSQSRENGTISPKDPKHQSILFKDERP